MCQRISDIQIQPQEPIIMNTLSKIAVLLLSLAILAIPAAAAMEEDHVFLVLVDPVDSTIDHITEVPAPGHESVPEHAELRPFFRDNDPEIRDCTDTNATMIIPYEAFVEGSVAAAPAEEIQTFEYAAVP